MFGKHYKTIIAVHDDDVYWFSVGPGSSEPRFFQMPLQQMLNEAAPKPAFPEWLKGSHKTLCILPDHWFGNQSFPFQSGKPSLIEPFVERKLLTAHPGQQAIRHFFNYRRIGDSGRRKLSVFYFQEDKSYQLYAALRKLNHSPHHITAPAFLWEDALQQAVDDFGRLGILLVHLTGKTCQLYFYYQGIYQFSRSVMATDTDEGLDALGYEINQSLYMFSQTAKSELDRIYIRCDSDPFREKLSDSLGREVIDLKPLMDPGASEILAIPQVEILNGWLKRSHLHSGARFFSIMHRQVKQAFMWRPVQWAGTIIGLVLLLGLAGEQVVLQAMLGRAEIAYRTQRQRAVVESPGAGLADYPPTLEDVLGRARRSMLVDAVHRLPASFPDHVELKRLELNADPESSPTVKMAAWVQARNADELQMILKQLMVELKGRLKGARALTLNDFDIRLNRPGGGRGPNRYEIDFRLELT
jgi:hypothetical protein